LKTEDPPAFFLSAAGEYKPLSSPRACWVEARLRNVARDDYMLVRIDPPVQVQARGITKQIAHVILLARYVGYSLFPISEWPSYVYVYTVLDPIIIKTRELDHHQVEMLAWGMIFPTRADAIKAAENLTQS